MSSKRPFYAENRPLYAENRSRSSVLVSAVVIGAATIVATGCGGDPDGPDLNPYFMVGDWLADSLVMTSAANPAVTTARTEAGVFHVKHLP